MGEGSTRFRRAYNLFRGATLRNQIRTVPPKLYTHYFSVFRELLRASDVDIKGLQCGASAPNDFAWPERLAEYGNPAVGRFTDGTERVAGVSRLIGVQAAAGEIAFEGLVFLPGGRANTQAKSFRFEACEQLANDLEGRSRNDQTAGSRFAERDVVCLAEFTDALEMAEEIEGERFRGGKSKQRGGPDSGGFGAAERLAAFGFDEFEANGLDAGAEVHGLNIEGVRRKIRSRILGVHDYSSAASMSPNTARKSGEALRTWSQSKKASGVSSQMRNHSAISFFSSRLRDSTLRLWEIISA